MHDSSTTLLQLADYCVMVTMLRASPVYACALQLHVLPEGGCEPAALLGCIRLVHWLAQPEVIGPHPLTLIVDCGTGTTAIGIYASYAF